ncbi:methyltransferase [Micromonospora sp. CB01531]|uniref:methyltransferase n=1 Tax=Micromonospora sp. CB01531 TaxID=1718947 RepID=UPI00093B07B6|nr:methyltransferase [Micromonospora sp. CB01531]OKI71697.1 methyltransferase [Micromonospora sp. CB01531]
MGTRRTIDAESIFKLLELGDYLLPYTIRAVCLLGVADHLVDGPVPMSRLARATGTHEPTLRKTLEYLATRELFELVEPDGVALTPLSDLLREGHPYSARDIFLSPVACTRAMEGLAESIRTGGPAFDVVHGRSMWEHLSAQPEDGEAFDKVMSGVTGMELLAVLRACDWRRFASIVDVGGGNGGFLASLLRRVRGARGVLFDLPGVVANAPEVLAAAGVADRVEVVPGSFLEGPIPPGGDAYVLKRILYSWSDDEVVGILGRVRAAMTPHSRLFVMEAGRQDAEVPILARRMDLLMHTLTAGGARTLEQQGELLGRAGLRLIRNVSTPMFPIIEAAPA